MLAPRLIVVVFKKGHNTTSASADSKSYKTAKAVITLLIFY